MSLYAVFFSFFLKNNKMYYIFYFFRLYRRISKRLERAKRPSQNDVGRQSPLAGGILTPRKSADRDLQESGIEPKSLPKIRKKLIFHNSLISELRKANMCQPTKTKKVLRNLVVGSIIRKYRGLRKIAGAMGTGRRHLGRDDSKTVEVRLHLSVRLIYFGNISQQLGF